MHYRNTPTVLTLAAGLILAGTAMSQAANIGNWDGSSSGRSWAGSTILSDLMTERGHTVEADGALTAGNLAGDDVFVITEATRILTPTEATDLFDWVTGGGRLLVTVDSGGNGADEANGILGALGSSLTYGGGATNGPLMGGSFLTEGPPFDIVGQSLAVSPGTGVSGGTALAGTFVAFEALGSGYIFAFGDHLQNNVFNNSETNTNGQMHINLVEGLGRDAAPAVPLPASLVLLAGGLGGLGLIRRRR